MGIRLLLAAQSPQWAGLSDRAFKVLSIMAASALDTIGRNGHPPRLYTAGQESIAMVYYGRDEITDNEKRIIKKTIRELRESGAISVAREGSFHTYPHYRLEIDDIPDHLFSALEGNK